MLESSTRKRNYSPAPRQNLSPPIKLPSDLHKRVNDYRHGLKHHALMPSVGIAQAEQDKRLHFIVEGHGLWQGGCE
jgi:hypothetical protein